jgi:1-acyl-sn-glycerol-3-phosphate acyltransferase
MIKATHHWFYTAFFDRYIAFIVKRDFKKIELEGVWPQSDKASLIIGNHISWWDGFWVLCLNKKLLKKKLHVMMLEEQLEQRRFLAKFGAYSIQPNSRTVIETLNYTVDLLSDANNSVLLYPQGKFGSVVQNEFHFERGIEFVLKKCPPVQLLFYAAFVDYFSNRKPTLYCYLKEIEYGAYSLAEMNELYQTFYNESRKLQLTKAR